MSERPFSIVTHSALTQAWRSACNREQRGKGKGERESTFDSVSCSVILCSAFYISVVCKLELKDELLSLALQRVIANLQAHRAQKLAIGYVWDWGTIGLPNHHFQICALLQAVQQKPDVEKEKNASKGLLEEDAVFANFHMQQNQKKCSLWGLKREKWVEELALTHILRVWALYASEICGMERNQMAECGLVTDPRLGFTRVRLKLLNADIVRKISNFADF